MSDSSFEWTLLGILIFFLFPVWILGAIFVIFGAVKHWIKKIPLFLFW